MLSKLKTFLKELFCKHIWETTDIKHLGTFETIEYSGGFIDGIRWKRWVETRKCLKCGKVELKEYSKFDTIL